MLEKITLNINSRIDLTMKKRPFSKNQILTLRKVLSDRPRDLALLNCGVDTGLRSSDLLSLKVKDLLTDWGEVRESFYVKMKKTQKQILIELSSNSVSSIENLLKVTNKEPDDYLFTSSRVSDSSKPLTTSQLRRVIKSWCIECNWDEQFFSSHSLRRSLSSEIYKKTKDLRTCQILLGHKNIGNTAEYLGVEQEDAMNLVRKYRI